MKTDFEEKTYESYFNSELSQKSKFYFPIGQVQEGLLGFDCSAYTHNRALWKLLGNPFFIFNHFQGCELSDFVQIIENNLENYINNFPKMKCNLLFQYKKPEYIIRAPTRSRNKNEWNYWKKPYFRYDIYLKQQKLLMKIYNNFSNEVFVTYASPALSNMHELVQAHLKKEIISNSNFSKVPDLEGHHRNTYAKAGNVSIACSEPSYIKNIDLIETLNQLEQDNHFNNNKSNKEFIIDFGKLLESLVLEDSFYGDMFHSLNEKYNEYRNYDLLYYHLVLQNFKHLTGIQWLVKV